MAKKTESPKQPQAVEPAPLPEARTVKDRLGNEVMPDVSEYLSLLGKQGRDRITGFAGVVGSISFDLYGCVQVALTPPVDKDGKLQDGRWMDVNRIDIVGISRVMPVPAFAIKPALHGHGPADKPAPRA